MKNTGKRLAALLLALSLLTACNNNEESSGTASGNTDGSSAAVSENTENSGTSVTVKVSALAEKEVAEKITYEKKNEHGKTVRIMPMGDSLTEGHFDPSAYRYVLFEYLYFANVDFEFVGPQYNRDTRLPEKYRHHAGYGGITIEGMYARLDDILPTYTPDVILLDLGCNISQAEGGKSAQIEQMKKLLTKIYELLPDVAVYVGAVLQGRWEENAPKNLPLNAALPDICEQFKAEGKKISYVPINENPLDDNDYTAEDGTHPLHTGDRKFAQVWYAHTVNDLLRMNDEAVGEADGTAIAVESVTLDQTAISLPRRRQKTLRATVAPSTATIPTVIWTTADEKIATVDRYSGLVTAVENGTTTVYASSLQGEKVASCEVTVTDAEKNTSYDKLLDEFFLDLSAWNGPESYLSAKRKLNVNGTAKYETKESYDLGGEYEVSVYLNVWGTGPDNSCFSVNVGDLQLRLESHTETVELRKGTQILGRVENFPVNGWKLELFAVNVHGNHVKVFRGNELVIDTETEMSPLSGKISFENQGARAAVRGFQILKKRR